MVVEVVKNEQELPIPTVWRPVLREIISRFVAKDYALVNKVAGVEPVDESTVELITEYITDYDAQLIELPEEAWESSIYMWQSSYWELLVDLYTVEEGRSDLVLSAQVIEMSGQYSFQVQMVCVP